MINHRLSTGFAALGIILFASCSPYAEHPHQKKLPHPAGKSATTPDPSAVKEQETLKQKEQETTAPSALNQASATPTPPVEKPKPTVEPKREYKIANKVPGKEGFVFSPFNNKVVDVCNIPSGTLVQDPTYPASEKMYFRVP